LYCNGHGRVHEWLQRHLRPNGKVIYHEISDCPTADSLAARTIRLAHHIIATSHNVAESIRGVWPQKNVSVIPCLVPPVCSPPLPAKEKSPRRELRVVFLGRLNKLKRPDQLVHEWRTLVKNPPLKPARLDMYGDSPDGLRLELEAWVREQNLTNQIMLHGSYTTTELPSILAGCDMVVLPSKWEGLPTVLIEAMLLGVPVVATGVGGTAELGWDNPNSIITEPNWKAFVEGLSEMAGRIWRGEIDGNRLTRWAEARYGFSRVRSLWQSFFNDPENFTCETSQAINQHEE
jgi:glycosyltransferase involved in cell wall biosynthesis